MLLSPRISGLLLPLLAPAAWALPLPDPDVAPRLEPQVLFRATDLPGGISVPLPSLLVTRHGTALAVAELRKASSSRFNDFGHESDLVLRRSSDGGKTWGPLQTIYADPAANAINGPIVEDQVAHRIVLPFSAVPSSAPTQADWVRFFAQEGGGIWTMSSADEGRTWSAPVHRRPIGRDGWVAWPGNDMHGIQLPDGRLVIAGFCHRVRPGEVFHALDLSTCLLTSDDHGATWRIGAMTSFYGTDEMSLALCADGSILCSIRINNRSPHDLVRLVGRSRDRGETFSEMGLQDHLSLCGCHCGMLQFDDNSRGFARHILAYSGPQGGHVTGDPLSDRSRLTFRLSYDDGHSWPVARQLLPDGVNTEYSDLAQAPDGALLCLYSAHQHSADGHIDLLRFTLASVESQYSVEGN